MPELPEVETIARELRPSVVGRAITSVWFDWPNQIKHPSPEAFEIGVRGREILDVTRRAKWLVLPLSGGDVLAIQVKMTGQLDVVPPTTPRDKHVHVVFSLDDGTELRLHDTRKFGRVALYSHDEARELLESFGPEPLGDEFTAADFKRRLHARRARLKPLLMDQAFLAGIGNIYADEALWRARLHPLRSAAAVKSGRAALLYSSLRDVLAEAIERRGSSVDSYRAPEGRGNMQSFLNVYGRTGKPCPRCGRPTRRIVIGQRSTHFCSWCQRLPRADRSAATDRILAGMR